MLQDLAYFPVTAVLGPRQCGKSTLIKKLFASMKNAVYLDLESPEDLTKLENPEYFFRLNTDKLICLDEIQRRPDLFPVLRSIIDRDRKPGQILISGSASPALLKQSSESLAGRISYEYLTPFTINEVEKNSSLENLWLKGGFPDSLLGDNIFSWKWRVNFLITFIERDLPQLGYNISSQNLNRFLSMVSHTAGQILNRSKLSESLGLSHNTISSYIDIFTQTFLIRTLLPVSANIKKRLIKSPKIYIRDTGLLHKLLGIQTFNDLLGHPSAGSSWESFCIENILATVDFDNAGFYRTSNGTELDLVLEIGKRKIAVEFKMSTAPKITKGFWNGLEDLSVTESWIICPTQEEYNISDRIIVTSLSLFIKHMT
ncbi:MAG: ATP-binding protein [Spirochaetia bacterium]|nr:ATP-binding protein [Spirochaetia bacterium]